MATYSRMALNNIIHAVENVKSDRSTEVMFLEDLNASIEKTEYSQQREPSKTFKPSGMTCMRSCFYTIMGLPISKEVRTASSCGIGESGTDRHVRIQQALETMKANGYDLEYIDVETYINTHGLSEKLQVADKKGMETKIYMPSLNMSFMTDGIIKYKDKYYIFEFKTEVPNKFYKREGIDPGHYTQGTAYSCAFDIPEVLFLYENRATCDRKAYILQVTDAMKNERIYDFISSVTEAVEQRKVPALPKDPDVIKKCKYCQYKALCASHGAGSNVTIKDGIING